MIYISRNFSEKPVGCVFTLLGSIFMLVALLLLAFIGHKWQQEQGYQSGQCTITARQLQHQVSTSTNTHTNGNGNTTTTTTRTDVYAPYFEYTVRATDGRSYPASGYDG